MIELEKIDFIDTTLDGEARYNINNNFIDSSIVLSTEIITKGTILNRAFFNKINRLFEEAAVFLENSELSQDFGTEKIDAVDEVLEGEERYIISDKNLNVIYNNCSIVPSNTVIQEGTKIDKKLFDKIDRNFESLFGYIYWKDAGEDIYNFFTKGTYNGETTPNLLDDAYSGIRGLD